MSKSIWSETVSIRQREPLTENIETDVAVIGGGLAGILTAYKLQERGKNVVVLEAAEIGSGQTKKQLQKSHHSMI